MTIHPSLRLVLLMLLAVAVQFLSLLPLALLGGLVLLAALYGHAALLRKVLRRSRWLLLTLLLVYAFTTPGEYLRGWDAYVPTYEGLHQGMLQALRLTIMLAGLAWLLGTTPRQQLMAGIYRLVQPLSRFGLAVDRFTARLWLTMHYVELAPPARKASFWQRVEAAANDDDAGIGQVRLELPHFTHLDAAVLLLALLLLWGLACV